MGLLKDLRDKKPLPISGSSTAGSTGIFNNAQEGENAFLSGQGQVMKKGWRPGDETLYIKPGHLIFLLSPGDEFHGNYIADEETQTCYPDDAYMLVSLRRDINGSGGNERLKTRLREGEGQVMCALFLQEGVGNSQEKLVGEMPFPNGKVLPVEILAASDAEIAEAKAKGKQNRLFWMSLTSEHIDACWVPEDEPEEEAVEDVLSVKTGEEAQAETPAAEEKPEPKGKKKKTGLKTPVASHPLEQPQGEVVNF